jgi:hypothetical protein
LNEYKRPHRDDEWSQEEIRKLGEFYPRPDKTIEEIASQLPGRTQNAIRLKASRLGLIRPFTLHWTPNSTLCPYFSMPLKEEKS